MVARSKMSLKPFKALLLKGANRKVFHQKAPRSKQIGKYYSIVKDSNVDLGVIF